MKYIEAMVLMTNGFKVTNKEFIQPFYWKYEKGVIKNMLGKRLKLSGVFALGNRYKDGWFIYVDIPNNPNTSYL